MSKQPSRQELNYMLVETYLRVRGIAEFLKPFALEEQRRCFFANMTPKQRQRWQGLGFPTPFDISDNQ